MTDASEPGETAPAKTPKEANLRPPWKKGQSGNPKGRPKGSRNKLSESFLKDCRAAWKENGKDALAKMAAERPGDFAKMVAGLVPAKFEHDHDHEHSGAVEVKTTVNVVHMNADADNE